MFSIFRRYFNPEVYNIVQLDQRGCGKSLPHAELEDNNTQVANIYGILQIYQDYNFWTNFTLKKSMYCRVLRPRKKTEVVVFVVFVLGAGSKLVLFQALVADIEKLREHLSIGGTPFTFSGPRLSHRFTRKLLRY